MIRNIFLTGFMGSGKTRVGKLLARKLGIKFYDTDQLIEQKYNRSVTQIFAQQGEQKFRLYEQEIVAAIKLEPDCKVVALGGGTLISTKIQTRLDKNDLLIYLKSSFEEIWQRLKQNRQRPLLLSGGETLSGTEFRRKLLLLFKERAAGYKQADMVVNQNKLSIDQVVDTIINRLQNYETDIPRTNTTE